MNARVRERTYDIYGNCWRFKNGFELNGLRYGPNRLMVMRWNSRIESNAFWTHSLHLLWPFLLSLRAESICSVYILFIWRYANETWLSTHYRYGGILIVFSDCIALTIWLYCSHQINQMRHDIIVRIGGWLSWISLLLGLPIRANQFKEFWTELIKICVNYCFCFPSTAQQQSKNKKCFM